MEKNSKFKENLKNFWDVIKFAIIAVIIVIPIRLFIAQPFVVSGESMFSTFHDKDYLIVDELSYELGKPKRGDVIVFRYPNDHKRFFIKRIIGLPNEKIEINNGKVTISPIDLSLNTQSITLDEPYINETFNTTATYTTGNDEYFVMGDNRNHSSDSRFWGTLPEKLIIGRAYLRLLPVKNIDYLPGSLEKFNLIENTYAK